jgi:hypothetical protein
VLVIDANEILLTASEVAREINRSRDSVYLWVRAGDLPVAFRTQGGMRLFRRIDVALAPERRRERLLRERDARRDHHADLKEHACSKVPRRRRFDDAER